MQIKVELTEEAQEVVREVQQMPAAMVQGIVRAIDSISAAVVKAFANPS